jgi:signal transduction histidine kinase
VNQLLRDLHQLVNVHPALCNNEFVVHPLGEEAGVRINGTDLIQILLNLTVNAFQCSPQSHRVEIQSRLLREPLDLTTFKDSTETRFLNVENFDNTAPILCVSIRDNGPGIPEEVLPKIFQPYFTTKSARQGTGLGLNIVQRLIKEAKGALQVETRVGEGTTFSIYVPAAPLSKV